MPISRKDLEADLAHYKEMVAKGERAFRGANKARQMVSYQNAIRNITRLLNSNIYQDYYNGSD